jgi:cytochrome c biogenesis protein CcmG/thiol:disulfide interchange protein DsbE
MLLEIARSGAVPLYGLNYKDQRTDALGWLRDLGDPYVLSVSDLDGRVGIDYGVYGAPETFLIDRNGVIRFKKIGPITPDDWQNKIQPLVRELSK